MVSLSKFLTSLTLSVVKGVHCSKVSDMMHASRISVCVVPFAVPSEGGEGHHCVAHLCDGVPVLPARGWPVLQLLPLPETGDYRHTTP